MLYVNNPLDTDMKRTMYIYEVIQILELCDSIGR